MTRVYLDTNYLFGLMRLSDSAVDPEYGAWRERVEAEIADDPALASDLVVDELAYRMVLAWLGDSGDRDPLTTYRNSTAVVMKRMRSRLVALWKALHDLDLDWASSQPSSQLIAQSLMSNPGLSPRDAFHAAYAIAGGCKWIVSSDAAYDHVSRLGRLGP